MANKLWTFTWSIAEAIRWFLVPKAVKNEKQGWIVNSTPEIFNRVKMTERYLEKKTNSNGCYYLKIRMGKFDSY